MFNFKKKKEKSPENIEEVNKEIEEIKKENSYIKKRLKEIEEEKKFFLKNLNLIRFNPFSDGGGDQSFSIAILDGTGTGVVITSLYAKEGNRVYSKAVEKGESNYPLSLEEKKAINSALKEGKE